MYRTLAILALCVGFVVPQCRLIHAQSSPPGFIHIDGRLHPELIPEWLAWQEGFRTLATAKNKNLSAFLDSLQLPPNEKDLVLEEASRQSSRESTGLAKMKQEEEASKTLPREAYEERLRRVDIDYRLTVLRARNRLLSKLSETGQASLNAWVLDTKRHIESSVAPADLVHFRSPE